LKKIENGNEGENEWKNATINHRKQGVEEEDG
jgi:hypothetical protein